MENTREVPAATLADVHLHRPAVMEKNAKCIVTLFRCCSVHQQPRNTYIWLNKDSSDQKKSGSGKHKWQNGSFVDVLEVRA